MFEIFILARLARSIGDIAKRKGLPVGRWKGYTILAWFGSLLFGITVSLLLIDDAGIGLLCGYALAIATHVALRTNLKKKPDADTMNEWINQIGSDSNEPLPTQG